jgi:glycyl-tRNA synthetase beta chain
VPGFEKIIRRLREGIGPAMYMEINTNGMVRRPLMDVLPLINKISLSVDGVGEVNRRQRGVVGDRVLEFLEDRLRYYLETVRRLRYDSVRAVLAAGWDVPVDALWRAEALERVRGSENFESLSLAAKRIKNILGKSATGEDWQPGEVDAAIIEEGPERDLYAAYGAAATEAGQLTASGEYDKALAAIAGLRPAVDRFFDKVLVMTGDLGVRQNRLRLLGKLDQLFSGIARFAEIVGGPGDVDASTLRTAKSDK